MVKPANSATPQLDLMIPETKKAAVARGLQEAFW
jgi:hypothetical protein